LKEEGMDGDTVVKDSPYAAKLIKGRDRRANIKAAGMVGGRVVGDCLYDR